jgi:hypothetical protein
MSWCGRTSHDGRRRGRRLFTGKDHGQLILGVVGIGVVPQPLVVVRDRGPGPVQT